MVAEETEEQTNNSLSIALNIPHIIKYMGSKSSLLSFLVESINEVYEGENICDLFAGTTVLSEAFGHGVSMHSNDIQEYSSVLANTYLGNYNWEQYGDLVEKVTQQAQNHVDHVRKLYPDLDFEYREDLELNEFNAIEQQQQDLIYSEFEDIKHHLFIKNYSGTYWSFEQCLWIDDRCTENCC